MSRWLCYKVSVNLSRTQDDLVQIALFLVLSSRKVAKLRSMDEVEYHTTEKNPDIAHLTLNVKKDRMLKSDVHVCY